MVVCVGLLEKLRSEPKPENVGSALRIIEGGVFQAEGTAKAKAEIQGGACHVCVKDE